MEKSKYNKTRRSVSRRLRDLSQIRSSFALIYIVVLARAKLMIARFEHMSWLLCLKTKYTMFLFHMGHASWTGVTLRPQDAFMNQHMTKIGMVKFYNPISSIR